MNSSFSAVELAHMKKGKDNEPKIRRMANPALLGTVTNMKYHKDPRISCSPDDLELTTGRGYEFKTRVTANAELPRDPTELKHLEYLQCQTCLALFQGAIHEWHLYINVYGSDVCAHFLIKWDYKLWNECLEGTLAEFANRCDRVTEDYLKLSPDEQTHGALERLLEKFEYPRMNSHEKKVIETRIQESKVMYALFIGFERK